MVLPRRSPSYSRLKLVYIHQIVFSLINYRNSKATVQNFARILVFWTETYKCVRLSSPRWVYPQPVAMDPPHRTTTPSSSSTPSPSLHARGRLPALHSPWRLSPPPPPPRLPPSSTAVPPYWPAARSLPPSARCRRTAGLPGSPAALPRCPGRSLPRRRRPEARRGCRWCHWRRCRAGSGA